MLLSSLAGKLTPRMEEEVVVAPEAAAMALEVAAAFPLLAALAVSEMTVTLPAAAAVIPEAAVGAPY